MDKRSRLGPGVARPDSPETHVALFFWTSMRGAQASGEGDDVPLRRTGNVSHIGNKHKRQDMYQKYRKEKARLKLQRRLKTAKEERTSTEGKLRRKVRRRTYPGTTRKKQVAHH